MPNCISSRIYTLSRVSRLFTNSTVREMSTQSHAELFRPPVDRAMRVLDRSFFKKTVALAVAQVHENNQIAPCRMALGQEVLKVDRVPSVRELASDQKPNSSGKALLLHPGIRAAGIYLGSSILTVSWTDMLSDSSTWSDKLRALVEEDKVAVSTYELQLDYDHWDYSK